MEPITHPHIFRLTNEAAVNTWLGRREAYPLRLTNEAAVNTHPHPLRMTHEAAVNTWLGLKRGLPSSHDARSSSQHMARAEDRLTLFAWRTKQPSTHGECWWALHRIICVPPTDCWPSPCPVKKYQFIFYIINPYANTLQLHCYSLCT